MTELLDYFLAKENNQPIIKVACRVWKTLAPLTLIKFLNPLTPYLTLAFTFQRVREPANLFQKTINLKTT